MKDETARTVRTAVQVLLAVCAAAPFLLSTAGVGTTIGIGSTVVAVCAAVTRLHQVPAVNELLNKYLKIPK